MFILPLCAAEVTLLSELSFRIKLYNENESFSFFAEDKKDCNFWYNELKRVCSKFSYSSKRDISIIRYRCQFSEFVSFDNTSKKKRFIGGTLEDILEFIIVHCLVYDSESTFSITEAFLSTFQTICSFDDILNEIHNMVQKRKEKVVLKRSWVSRFQRFSNQIIDSKTCLSLENRNQIIEKLATITLNEKSLTQRPSARFTESDVEVNDFTQNIFNLNPQWDDTNPISSNDE